MIVLPASNTRKGWTKWTRYCVSGTGIAPSAVLKPHVKLGQTTFALYSLPLKDQATRICAQRGLLAIGDRMLPSFFGHHLPVQQVMLYVARLHSRVIPLGIAYHARTWEALDLGKGVAVPIGKNFIITPFNDWFLLVVIGSVWRHETVLVFLHGLFNSGPGLCTSQVSIANLRSLLLGFINLQVTFGQGTVRGNPMPLPIGDYWKAG